MYRELGNGLENASGHSITQAYDDADATDATAADAGDATFVIDDGLMQLNRTGVVDAEFYKLCCFHGVRDDYL